MTDQSTLINAVRAWATENYQRGGDVIVEAFTDDEIASDLLDGVTTEAEAVASAREFCGLHEEQKANVLSQSGEHDAEAAQAMANARSLDDDAQCPGHPAGPFDPMGQTVYCDGTCQTRSLR
jgi:hypothetical protein